MSKAALEKASGADKQAFTEAARLAGQAARKFDDDVEAEGLARLLGVALAEQLWQQCSRRKAMWIRTKLCEMAEREDGVRQGRRGRDLT